MSTTGITFWPDEAKVAKWLGRLREIERTGLLCAGDASKLCGALQWASQHTFKRLGRAMLRPLIWSVYLDCKSVLYDVDASYSY